MPKPPGLPLHDGEAVVYIADMAGTDVLARSTLPGLFLFVGVVAVMAYFQWHPTVGLLGTGLFVVGMFGLWGRFWSDLKHSYLVVTDRRVFVGGQADAVGRRPERLKAVAVPGVITGIVVVGSPRGALRWISPPRLRLTIDDRLIDVHYLLDPALAADRIQALEEVSAKAAVSSYPSAQSKDPAS